MATVINFDDSDRFGDMSFLDILEENHVAFTYDGRYLEFHKREHEVLARNLWLAMTGSSVLGGWISNAKESE